MSCHFLQHSYYPTDSDFIMSDSFTEEWFTLEDLVPVGDPEDLFCIAVDAPEKQFLAGRLAFPTHNTEEGKAEDSLKGEASMILGSIARLGRAAGVHLVIATQRPDATIITGETKANLGVRINCGRTDSNASSMILGSGEGARVKANPRGRLYIRIYSPGNHGQGFFASPDWIDKYLAGKGLNPDGTPITQPRSKLANLTDFSDLEAGDLDSREGVDNERAIERIREEEAYGIPQEDSAPPVDPDFIPPDDPASADLERPYLDNGRSETSDKFHRPEEDWDADLEALIAENFDE